MVKTMSLICIIINLMTRTIVNGDMQANHPSVFMWPLFGPRKLTSDITIEFDISLYRDNRVYWPWIRVVSS
jgi:hypothetical protein